MNALSTAVARWKPAILSAKVISQIFLHFAAGLGLWDIQIQVVNTGIAGLLSQAFGELGGGGLPTCFPSRVLAYGMSCYSRRHDRPVGVSCLDWQGILCTRKVHDHQMAASSIPKFLPYLPFISLLFPRKIQKSMWKLTQNS